MGCVVRPCVNKQRGGKWLRRSPKWVSSPFHTHKHRLTRTHMNTERRDNVTTTYQFDSRETVSLLYNAALVVNIFISFLVGSASRTRWFGLLLQSRHLGGKGRRISEFEAGLVYRTARGT